VVVSARLQQCSKYFGAPAHAQGADLVQTLVDQLGISGDQAMALLKGLF
jgi:hypothetical protein